MSTRHLGQITKEIIKGWADQYDQKDGKYYCPKCDSRIKQVTCYVSLHLRVLEPGCAGPGKVKQINYPFCPTCDGNIEHVTACYHI